MKKVASVIVENKNLFFLIFLILTIFSVLMFPNIKVNYDLSKYLPKDSETLVGLELMKSEFGSPGMVIVMTKNLSLISASEMRNEINNCEGVSSVVFLDTLLLSMKDDDSLSDEQYIDQMFDMLSIVYKIQAEYFPDRSLSYVYEKLLDFIESAEGSGGIAGEFDLSVIFSAASGFGSGGTDISNIRPEDLAMLENYYKDNCALLTVSMSGDDYADITQRAVENIIRIASGYGESYFSGSAASFYFNQADNSREMLIITVLAVILAFLIIVFTTKSFAEPLIYLIIILVAVVINLGTNVMFESISSYANMVSAILQMALSMDYSIFLLHAYQKEKLKTLDKKQAMKNALSSSFVSISASSLTTIAGFVALMFMAFGIGLDFGLVLAKGIIFSLLGVFLLMPGLVLSFDRLIKITSHKGLGHFFNRTKKVMLSEEAFETDGKQRKSFLHKYSDFLFRLKKVIPILFVIIMIPMYFFQANNNFFFGEYQDNESASTYMTNSIEITKVFGRQNQAAILISNDYSDKEEGLCEKLRAFSFVRSITNYSLLTSAMAEGEIPHEIEAQFHGLNYIRIVLTFDLPDESPESFAAIDRVEQLLASTFGEQGDYHLLGTTSSTYEIMSYSLSDSLFINLLTLGFILIILFISFKSLGITLILGIIIQGATWINMSIPFLMGQSMHFIGYMIVSAVQMGATIDYGILLTSKYMEYRKTRGKKEAIREALSNSYKAILTSASILTIVGYVLYFYSTSTTACIMGQTIARGTIISTISMLFVLPQALTFFDKFIMKTTWRGKKKMADIDEDECSKTADD